MDLYLHIGHGKTGSSALQSFFALNTRLLSEYGIVYPEHISFSNAKKGYISSGNLPAPNTDWNKYISNIASKMNHDGSLLFSQETLIFRILKDPEKLLSLKEKYNLVLILYVRDPLDHVFSSYGQHIKRDGETKRLSEWIGGYKVIDKVIKLIDLCKEHNIELKLINYSKVKSVEESFINTLLGQKSDDFLNKAHFSQTKQINRSLTRVEYKIQRCFNEHIGKESSKFVSDYLVNNLPDIQSEKEFIEDDILDLFIEQNKDKVAYINTFLDEDDRLDLNKPKDLKPESDVYKISAEQIEVLVESLSERILKIMKNNKLNNSDADSLRTIALKYTKNQNLSLEDAHYLMDLAHKARPDGIIIQKNLKKFKKQLQEQRSE